jgi:hypothetical protein
VFKVKTVFVLGAGASVEAGLPTGEALKPTIAKLLDIKFDTFGRSLESGDHAIVNALRQCAHPSQGGDGTINLYIHEARAIRDNLGLAISIDNYIDAHRGNAKLELCGKLAIVRAILSAESKSIFKSGNMGTARFPSGKSSGTWYETFFKKMTEGLSKDDLSSIPQNLSLIIFNYDRCFEHFLAQSLQDYFKISADAAQHIVSQIQIVHPYGTVGSLPWQGGENPIAFGDDEPNNLLRLASSIKTFTQGMSDDNDRTKLDDITANAETIVYLGFSYQD